jgi:hypothetical protein
MTRAVLTESEGEDDISQHGNSGACGVGLSCRFSRQLAASNALEGNEAVFLGHKALVLRVLDRADLVCE